MANGWGGARLGAGRKLEPTPKVISKMKRYLNLCYTADFKLMAHLALRPEEFADQVQFAGKEEDSLDKDGKQSQARTGGYQLDPIFKARLDLLKMRVSRILPDVSKENPDIQVNIQNNLWSIIQNISDNSQRQLEIQSAGANGSLAVPSTNGNAKPPENLPQGNKSQEQSVTGEAKAGSSPFLELGS